jgi:predicted amidohydrolase YtcJ
MFVGTLWYGGKIYTMEKENDVVEAIYVERDVIKEVGTYNNLVNKYRNSISETRDLKGNVLFPGFVDSHLHLIGHGEKLLRLDFSEMTSSTDMVKELRKKVETVPKGEWIIGEGWNENEFVDRKILHRNELDNIAPNHPMMLTRVCRHAVLANSMALEAAGITDETPNPAGGVIVRDKDGRATGYLLDQAQELVKNAVPTVSQDYLKQALSMSINDLLSKGIVGGHSEDLNYYGGFKRTFDTFKEVINGDEVKFKAHLLVHHEVTEDMLQYGYQYGKHTDYIEIGSVKIFADGALGGRTALLSQPYNDHPETSGVAIHTQSELDEIVKKARGNNMPVAIHTIGDLALEFALNSIEKYPVLPGQRDRLIHAQILRPELIERMKKLPIILDIQTLFTASDFPWVIERLGEDRMKWSYAWKTLLDEQIPCAGGSDAPIENVDPLLGIHAAITRAKPSHPGEGYYLNEALTAFEAISLYTSGSAYAVCQEDTRGYIKAGYKADFTVYDKDLLEVSPDEMLNASVVLTVVDNELMFEQKKSS